MKVYVCIKEKPVESNVVHVGLTLLERIRIGDLFVEPKGESYNYLRWDERYKKRKTMQSYVASTGYPKSRELIEDNPEYFQLLIDDDEHETDYYIHKKYSQFEVDKMINGLK